MPAASQSKRESNPAGPSATCDIKPDLSIDITPFACPMTFVRTRIALDRLLSGQLLAVRLRGDEPRRSVPLTVRDLGHEVLSIDEQAEGTAVVLIRKACR